MAKINYYMVNMQKLLFIVRELHQRGYENLHIIPSVSPNGMAWRCEFAVITNDNKKETINVSGWLSQFIKNENKEIAHSIHELSDLLEKENMDFFEKCKGKNPEYVKWFTGMVGNLQKEELPYAFADYCSPTTEYWYTSLDKKIKILSDESQYYL